jgi:hypothetical protein
MYKYQIVPSGKKVIIKDEGSILISFFENPKNTDYKQYLEWVAEGNEAEEWVAE